MRITHALSKSVFLACLLACAAAFPCAARAQNFDLSANRLPITPVDSAWRFHLGDDSNGDKGWSQPAFDDSAWPTLKPTEDWTTQGYPASTELAWFRFHLRVPPHTPSLVLELPAIQKSYQLFCDGQLIAQADFQLPDQARITLLSDGVIEARSHTGELFGFERTSEISHLTASEIAAIAHSFGQEDDITVITLNWHTQQPATIPA
jgi:hypothetical protein